VAGRGLRARGSSARQCVSRPMGRVGWATDHSSGPWTTTVVGGLIVLVAGSAVSENHETAGWIGENPAAGLALESRGEAGRVKAAGTTRWPAVGPAAGGQPTDGSGRAVGQGRPAAAATTGPVGAGLAGGEQTTASGCLGPAGGEQTTGWRAAESRCPQSRHC